jgi:hypothetical protein
VLALLESDLLKWMAPRIADQLGNQITNIRGVLQELAKSAVAVRLLHFRYLQFFEIVVCDTFC